MGLAQSSDGVMLRENFQGDTGTWKAMGERASVRPAEAAPGMVFSYDLAPKTHSGIVTAVPADFAGMQRMRLHVKTDHATAMGVLLSEKKPGGGNYTAWFWSPADTWQWIELTPADFTVNDGEGDPQDADGKLDLGDVEGVGLFDLGQFFSQVPAANFPMAVHVDAGRHNATMDAFEVYSTPAAAPARGFLDWVTLGQMDLKLNSGPNPLNKPALEAHYQEVDGQYQLLLRRISGAAMAKSKRLVFDIASDRDVTLMLAVEMSKPGGGQGPRYTVPIYPPGGREVFHVNLDLADFHGDGKFDPARWRTFSIVDITTAGGGAPAPNTLWIGNMEVQ